MKFFFPLLPRLYYFTRFIVPDVSLGGFGPLFGLATICAVSGVIAMRQRNAKQSIAIYVGTILILSGFINPQLWWGSLCAAVLARHQFIRRCTDGGERSIPAQVWPSHPIFDAHQFAGDKCCRLDGSRRRQRALEGDDGLDCRQVERRQTATGLFWLPIGCHGSIR